jgi:hypothetical protein
MIWIGSWGSDAKDQVEFWLKRTNEAIAAAIDALDAGDYGEAAAEIRKAIGYKHEAIQSYPPVLVNDTNHRIEFYELYDALFELDELAANAENFVVGARSGNAPNAVQNLIDQMKQARDRLTGLRLNDPQFADGDCVDLANSVIDEIDQILKMLDEFDRSKGFDFDHLHRLVKQLTAAKKLLLDNLSDGYGISLWDGYALFYAVDDELLTALSGVESAFAQGAPRNARANRATKEHLELAKAIKNKLESFVGENPAPSEPPENGDGAPPEPKYPQGSEDLPPFPPNVG